MWSPYAALAPMTAIGMPCCEPLTASPMAARPGANAVRGQSVLTRTIILGIDRRSHSRPPSLNPSICFHPVRPLSKIIGRSTICNDWRATHESR